MENILTVLWQHCQLIYGDSSYVGGTVIADRQEVLLKAFMIEYGIKINPKQNLVTFSDGSQIVTETYKVAHKLGQRRWSKLVVTAPT